MRLMRFDFCLLGVRGETQGRMTTTTVTPAIGHVGIERHVVPTRFEGWPIAEIAQQWPRVSRSDKTEAVALDFFGEGFQDGECVF